MHCVENLGAATQNVVAQQPGATRFPHPYHMARVNGLNWILKTFIPADVQTHPLFN